MRSSIGIQNGREGIRLYFGEKGSFTLMINLKEKGSIVQIIPSN